MKSSDLVWVASRYVAHRNVLGIVCFQFSGIEDLEGNVYLPSRDSPIITSNIRVVEHNLRSKTSNLAELQSGPVS